MVRQFFFLSLVRHDLCWTITLKFTGHPYTQQYSITFGRELISEKTPDGTPKVP